MTDPTSDPIIAELKAMLDARSAMGMAKYGVGLNRTDLPPEAWAQLMLEELLDAAGYVLRLKHDLARLQEAGR